MPPSVNLRKRVRLRHHGGGIICFRSSIDLKLFEKDPNMVEDNVDQPIFADENADFTLDLLEDHLNHLSDEGVKLKNVGEDEPLRGEFRRGIYVSAISMLCRTLNQSPQVKYHAIELFDLFMSRHLREVLNQTRDCYGKEWCGKWPVVLKRISSQVLLRLLSCIQIASKIRNQETSVVRLGSILFTLRKTKRTFNKESVFASEIRVLRTVSYEANVRSPLDHMETILEVLARNDPCINAIVLYRISLRILDVACLEEDKLYEKLYQRVTGNQRLAANTSEIQRWKLIKSDFTFFTVAVLSCGAYLLNPCSYIRVVNGLQTIVNIPLDEIMDFTVVLIDFILQR